MSERPLDTISKPQARKANTPRLSQARWGSKWHQWHGLPPRYGLIILGSGLLMFAGGNRILSVTANVVKPQEVLVLFAALAGMLSLIVASSPFSAPLIWHRWYRWARYPVYAGALFLVLGTLFTFAGTLNLVLERSAARTYDNDVMSFTHVNAELVLAGRNPYTSDAVFAAALEQYPLAYPTALRKGVFGMGYDPPGIAQIKAAERLYLTKPQAVHGALDPKTLHSYPALSFLFYVPFIWAGLPNILLLNLLICLSVLVWVAWQAPGNWRVAALFTAGTAFCIAYSLPVDTEIVCIALLLAAWHLRERKWLAPVLLGLACAFKQYSWFFVPCFILEIWLTQGNRATLRWCSVMLAAFLLPNLPYLVTSPLPWLESLFLPMTEPLFPQGIGIMALSLGHLLPYGPPLFYSACELLALSLVLWLQLRHRELLGDAVLLLAVVPLLLAFRSPPNYFAFTPWLALYAANRVYALRVKGRQQNGVPQDVLPIETHQLLTGKQ